MARSAARAAVGVFILAAGPLIGLAGCAGGAGAHQRGPEVVTGAAIDGREGFYRAGSLSFGGQPAAGDFQAFRDEGVTTVINLRSRQEMADLLVEEGVDEASAVQADGMRYIHLPLGGDDGYEPADVEAFAAAVESAPGPVLIHCASGGRVRTMWQAYLVKHRGYTPAAAERVAATIGGGPSALEQLLGRDMRPSLGERLPPPPEPVLTR